MEIRRFSRSDSETVVSLWKRCALTVPWNDPYRDIERKLDTQPELFLVGVQEQRIVGSVMGGYDGHRGWIYYLAIDPDFQNRGYGSQLITEIERRLQKIGCPKINLMVRNTNQAVIDFYQQRGYRADEVVSLGKRLIND